MGSFFGSGFSITNRRGPQKCIFTQLKKDREAFFVKNLKLIFGSFRSN